MSIANTGCPVDPTKNNDRPTETKVHTDFLKAALMWFFFGFKVIPLIPRKKITAVIWDPWLANLSQESIVAYWKRHPDHEVGFIVGDGHIVLDADSPESLANLVRIEVERGVSPRLIVKTRKGAHHHFGLAAGTFARSASFSTEKFPARIDVKTGRGMVVLPPSTGKKIDFQDVDHADQLSEVDQDFIDAIARNNDRQPPRPRPVQPEPAPSSPDLTVVDEDSPLSIHNLGVLIKPFDPDESYDDWVDVGMILNHETGGSDEGLRIFDAYSARGAKYPGFPEIQYKWQSFGGYAGTPKTIGTLKWMLKERGLDWQELLAAGEPDFTVIDPTEVVESGATMRDRAGVTTRPVDATDAVANPASETTQPHPLERMSITGQYQDLVQASRGLEPVLGQIAMRGQYTLIFAAPGKGKTLLTLHLIEEGIAEGRLDPSHVFYVNADDSEHGMLEKLKLAEELGIGMLVPGFNKFSPKQLPGLLTELGQSGQASQTIVILDTLKKATPTNDKAKISVFNEHVRGYITLGGTFIALHHVNKNRNEDGEVVFSGTSDLVDDIDAGLLLDVVSTDELTKTQTVVFKRIKGRGGVVHNAAYRFSIADGLSYKELLASVEEVDPDTLEEVRQAEQVTAQGPIIEGIKACIRAGTTLKMSLIRSVANQLGASQRKVQQVLEDHTGTDPMRHHWTFTKGVRGALNYSLL